MRYTGILISLSELRDRWLVRKVSKDNFSANGHEMPRSALLPFEHTIDEEEEKKIKSHNLATRIKLCLNIIKLEKEQ